MSDTTQTTIAQASAVIQRAATDPAFRQQLMTSPAAALQSAGIEIPAGAQVRAVEISSKGASLVVPARPSDLADSDLQSALGTAGSTDDLAALGELFAKSWSDSGLKASVTQNASSTLAAHGISVPSGLQLSTIEATDNVLYVAVPPASLSSTTSSSVTLGDLADSINSSFTNLTKLITAGSYLAGLGFSIGAIMKFKQHKDNPTQIPVGTPIALLFIAAALLFLPSILSAAGYTMFGNEGGKTGT